MSFETWFRIIFALIALGMAGYLVAVLVTARARVGGRVVERHAAPRTYWGAVGKTAILAAGLATAAALPADRYRLPVIFLGLFGGQLFEMLVSGIVQMPKAAFARANQPGAYWRWVAFHAAIVVLLLAFVIVQRFTAIIL